MGKGGGGGGRTPVEAKESGRSKQLVKIVEIISEGEIEGLADGMKSVYLDNTPIQNTDGSYNFSNVQLEGRVGSQVQEIIPGFNTSEKEINVGTQVRKTTPITRTVTDSKVSRLRLTLGVQSLFQQNDQGDTNSASVSLTVYIGNQSYPITISGKYSSQYLQQHTFSNLPAVPFTVRVERNTADSKSQRLQNNTVW
ncbi:TipJ family phage tail tip protein, partial [Rodentibacter pneumotropicus]